MIQELLSMVEGRKICTQGSILLPDGSSLYSSSTPISSPSSSQSPMSSSSPPTEAQQNLKCPRCDSSNTKFCYYNNYNLTQPRHFCKTCRRYWTKGGALRNVPIGGGCRRGKPSPPLAAYRSVSSKAKTASPNAQPTQPTQDQELPPCPVLWASPYSSQLLALLRASQLQNPNPNPNPTHNLNSDGNGINEQSLSSDKLSQLAAGAYDSLWRSGSNQQQYNQQQHMMVGEAQNSGNQEFLQRLRSSPANYYSERLPAPPVMSSAASFSPPTFATGTMVPNNGTGTIVKPLPLAGGDFGYWNPGYSTLVDLNAKNGAFP